MKLKLDSKQFGIVLLIIYIILIVPLTFLLIKTGSDLNKLSMNPGFITAEKVQSDYPKLFFIIVFSLVIGLISILSFLFYIKRNKSSIDFDETITFEHWKEDQSDDIVNHNKDIASDNEDLPSNINDVSLKSEILSFPEDAEKEEKADYIIQYLCNKLEAGLGAIYIAKQDKSTEFLEFAGGYAFFKPKNKTSKILFGEGLTGQVAKSQKTIVIDNMDDGKIHIFSGLGKSHPKSLIVVPILRGETTIGVIEIASFTSISMEDRNLIEASADIIASEF